MDPVFTGWLFTDAMRFADCPKCEAKAGEPCKTPKGRKAYPPHGARQAVLTAKYGFGPWRRVKCK